MSADAELLNTIRLSRQREGQITVELPEEALRGPRPKPGTGAFNIGAAQAGSVANVGADPSIALPELSWRPRSLSRGLRALVAVLAAVPLALLAVVRWLLAKLAPPIESTMSLGFPQAIELPPSAGAAHGLELFAGGPTAYHLVHLACSFEPRRRERFVRASLAIELKREDGLEDPPPIAWSMEPQCLAHVTELSRTQKVDASFKFLSVSLGGEMKSQRTECRIQAFNELQPNPRWEFRQSRGAQIRGTQRLVLVVQAPAPTRAMVSLVADVRGRGLPGLVCARISATSHALTLETS